METDGCQATLLGERKTENDARRGKHGTLREPASKAPPSKIAPQTSVFESITARFRNEDLKHSVNADLIVGFVMENLLQQEWLPLGLFDRLAILKWMEKDPFLREAVLKEVEKVLPYGS